MRKAAGKRLTTPALMVTGPGTPGDIVFCRAGRASTFYNYVRARIIREMRAEVMSWQRLRDRRRARRAVASYHLSMGEADGGGTAALPAAAPDGARGSWQAAAGEAM